MFQFLLRSLFLRRSHEESILADTAAITKLNGPAMQDQRVLIVLCGTAFLGLVVSLPFLLTPDPNVKRQLFAVMILALTFVDCYVSWRAFARVSRLSFFGETGPSLLVRLFISSILLGVLMELGTLAGAQCATVLNFSDWQPVRICLLALVAFSFLVFIVCVSDKKSSIRTRRHRDSSLTPIRTIALRSIGVLSISLLVSFFVWFVFRIYPLPLFTIAVGVTLLILCTVFTTQRDRIQPHNVFLTVSLCVGFSIIGAFPATNMLSWDDEIHYANALNLSYVMNPEVSASDTMMQTVGGVEPGFSDDATLGRNEIVFSRGRTWTQQEFAYDQAKRWSRQSISAFSSELDAHDIDQPVESATEFAPSIFNYSALSYVPAALGLWMGRLLGLSFTFTFALGKLFNLLCYTAIVFNAIRIIPVKKWLFLALGLLPTNIFLASNYSYDWFLTAFTMLAIAVIVRVICSGEKVRTRDLWLILICLFLAIAPKAVYFPIVGLIFLVPRKAFQSRTQRRAFIAVAVAIVVYACLTFLLPVFFSGGAAYSDSRAGTGASPALQLAFILSEPLSYLKILVSYLYHEFFALGNIETAFADYYYMGQLTEVFPTFQGVLLVCGSFIALTDSSERSAKLISAPSILWCTFMVLCTAAFISSAIYVSFTEVGLNTVIGVQPRYFLPLLPLLGIFVFNFPLANHIPERAYGISVSLMSGGLPLLTTWLFVVSRVVV